MIVVDTNILIYRWIRGPRSEETDRLLRFDPVWTAPPLWRLEMRNVLAGELRNGRMSFAEAESAVSHAAESLLGGEHFVADDVVFRLIGESKCTAYDCELVGLAQMFDALLITEDKAILRTFPHHSRSLLKAAQDGLSR